MLSTITVSAPATIANLVCGFDILGLALKEPADRISLRLIDEPVVRIRHSDGMGLSEDPDKNVAGVVLKELIRRKGLSHGFDAVLHKGIRPGSGIGSSAASSAAAAVAGNILTGETMGEAELVDLAMEGEKLASGSKHADNVAPCILGGITLVRSADPPDIIRLDYPLLFVTVIHPHIEVKTSDARNILKPDVSLKAAVKQWGNVAGLVAGFYRKDYGLISRSLEDVIIEPQRSVLIPGLAEVKEACRFPGLLGGGISGSGPSLFMLSSDRQAAARAAESMALVYQRLGIGYEVYITEVSEQGAGV